MVPTGSLPSSEAREGLTWTAKQRNETRQRRLGLQGCYGSSDGGTAP
jgi:hypothetical protein